MILLANLIAVTFPRIFVGLVYFGLIGSCALFYFFDLVDFVYLSYVKRAILVGSLTVLSVLFSGIIFIRSFVESPDKYQAFGVNLMGSLVGGLLQLITFVIGIKVLLLVVAALYLASAVTGLK